MDLEKFEKFVEIDKENMYGHIRNLPDQLENAWKIGQDKTLPKSDRLKAVVITGVGGSAIGAELTAAYVTPLASIPVMVVREYDLPAWIKGPDVLVIGSSHSGNTEETLSAFQQAGDRGCQLMSISTGGKLQQMAEERGFPAWIFDHQGQPRAAVGYSFGLMVSVLCRIGVISDPEDEIQKTVAAMKQQQDSLAREIPVSSNPAKRIAEQLYGRWVMVLGSDYLTPVARRWKGQVSEVAKAWAQFEALPEADHNTLSGIFNPKDMLAKLVVLFLRSGSDHPRNRLREELTRKTMMAEGITTDFIEAGGDTPMGNMWTALHYGDYAAYYLSMLYEVDPTPITAMVDLKKALSLL
ncbi:MAG: bifunctional phosphoglucose/phosphomannose isomerase [Anaerolineaceae bacterium]|nr:bifunctional phosphoglucose/phosphomannose isomerase [Anaerolineaceae bacterium]